MKNLKAILTLTKIKTKRDGVHYDHLTKHYLL